jgi:hypothetical protein
MILSTLCFSKMEPTLDSLEWHPNMVRSTHLASTVNQNQGRVLTLYPLPPLCIESHRGVMEEEHLPPAPDPPPPPSSPPTPAPALPRVPVNSMAELAHVGGGCCLPVLAAGPCLVFIVAEVARDGGGCLPFPAAGPSLAVVEAELPRVGSGLPVPAS